MGEKNKEHVGDINKELDNLKQEYEDLKTTLQRLQAEFSNYQKRTEKEKKQFISLANNELIKKLLPLMDNFELALEAKETNEDFRKGMEMIYSQMQQVMEDEGLTRIETKGKFDPNKHEAILVEEGEKHNEIKQVLQHGYKIGDRVIRHAKVKIIKQKKDSNESGSNQKQASEPQKEFEGNQNE